MGTQDVKGQKLFVAFNRLPQYEYDWANSIIQYSIGEKPTVILYTYVNLHAETPNQGKTLGDLVLSHSVIQCIDIGFGFGIYRNGYSRSLCSDMFKI